VSFVSFAFGPVPLSYCIRSLDDVSCFLVHLYLIVSNFWCSYNRIAVSFVLAFRRLMFVSYIVQFLPVSLC
jgi:hypothetical protein